MNKQTLDKLDYYRLLAIIAERCHSPVSKDQLMSLRPLSELEEIELRMLQIEELRRFIQQSGTIGLEEFVDLEPLLTKNTPQGAVLDGLELYHFIAVLNNAQTIVDLFGQDQSAMRLRKVTDSIQLYPDLLSKLKKAVDSEGNIIDSASEELRQIRLSIRSLEAKIRRRLEELIQSKEISVFLQDTFITQRSGRWVIPVRMDSKGQVSGVVHDVSKSGETAFVEPLSIISLTNELENLRADEKAEELRILRELSALIRSNAEGIKATFDSLVYFDVINAIAIYAETMSMQAPQVVLSGDLKIVNGRHPLLFKNLKERSRETELVPLDLTLQRSRPVMVITGPNAGGKTVVLKTVGLLTLMALTGMPVPASSLSVFPLFKKVLVDMGDEQSIEDSLSTFAGHISNLSRFVLEADRDSLILIDELGTGTDPLEGSALASAILEELKDRSAMVIANTHLSEIKGFVHRSHGMVNASMEFDPKRFKPLYRLVVGMPGQSYAFETARRYGMIERVIERAGQLLGTQKLELDNMLRELHTQKRRYDHLVEEMNERLRELERQRLEIESAKKEAQRQKQELILQAHREAEAIVQDAKRELHDIFEKTKKDEKASIKSSLKELNTLQQVIRSEIERLSPRDERGGISLDELKEGDWVFSKTLEANAKVIQINPKQHRVKIQAQGIEFEVPLKDLSLIRGKKQVNDTASFTKLPETDRCVTTINLIGKRVDEALSELEPFLNHAFLSGISEVTIIHGIGTGQLRRAIHDHLKGHSLIKKFRQGNHTEGGAGITVASFV